MSSFLSLTGLSPSLAGFPKTFLLGSMNQLCGPNPGMHAFRFGLFPFRSPLLWKSIFLSNERTCFFLFLRLLRCFSSPGSPPYVMDWRMDTWGMLMWVSPFRHLRIKGYLLLPVAFRSLSRLSSALSAKASTLRSFLLDLVYSFYSVRNWVFAFNNADRIASILNFRSFGLVVNFVYDILGCLDKKSFSSKSSVWSFQGTIANFVRIRNCFAISATSAFFNAFVTVWLNVYQSLETSTYWNL